VFERSVNSTIRGSALTTTRYDDVRPVVEVTRVIAA
jgi:hypothetical protein